MENYLTAVQAAQSATQEAPSCNDASTVSAPTNPNGQEDSPALQNANKVAVLLASECNFDEIAEPNVYY